MRRDLNFVVQRQDLRLSGREFQMLYSNYFTNVSDISIIVEFVLSHFFSPQGVRFDPDQPQTIRLEFAKSNTKVTKPKQTSPQPANLPVMGPHPGQLTPRDPCEYSAAMCCSHCVDIPLFYPIPQHCKWHCVDVFKST